MVIESSKLENTKNVANYALCFENFVLLDLNLFFEGHQRWRKQIELIN